MKVEYEMYTTFTTFTSRIAGTVLGEHANHKEIPTGSRDLTI